MLELLVKVSNESFYHGLDIEVLEKILDRVKELYEEKEQKKMVDNGKPH